MKTKKLLIPLTVISIALFSLGACSSYDGPAEKTGKKMDKTAKNVGNAIEDACEDVKKGVNAEDTDC